MINGNKKKNAACPGGLDDDDAQKETYIQLIKDANGFSIYVQTKPLSQKATALNPKHARYIAYFQDKLSKKTVASSSNAPRPKRKRVEFGEVTQVMHAKNLEELFEKVRDTCPKVKFLVKAKTMKTTSQKEDNMVMDLKPTKHIYSQRNKGPREVLPTSGVGPLILVLEGNVEAVLFLGTADSLGDVMNELNKANMETGTVRCPCIGFGQTCEVNVVMRAMLDDEGAMQKLFEKQQEVAEELKAAKIGAAKKDADLKIALFGKPDPLEGGRKAAFDKHDKRFDIRVYGKGLDDANTAVQMDTELAAIGFKAFYAASIKEIMSQGSGVDLTMPRIVYRPEGTDLIYTIRVRIREDAEDIVFECERYMWRDVPHHCGTPYEYASAVMMASTFRELNVVV